MPPAAITITYPTPGATLGPNFKVCGVYDCGHSSRSPRQAPTQPSNAVCPVTAVTLNNGTNQAVANSIACCQTPAGHWEATFVGAPIGNDYVLTAFLDCGDGQTASHAIETVDVVVMPPINVEPLCCGETPPAPHTLLPAGTSKDVTIKFENRVSAARQLLAIPQAVVITETRLTRNHYKTTSTAGALRVNEAFAVDLRLNSTELTLRLCSGEYVRFILLDQDGKSLGGSTSARF